MNLLGWLAMVQKLRKLDTPLKGVCVLTEKFLPMGLILALGGLRFGWFWRMSASVLLYFKARL